MKLTKIDFKRKPTPFHYDELQLTGDIYFTPKQVKVLACLTSGKSSYHIGRVIGIKPASVDNIVCQIHRKLNLHSRYDVISFLEKSGQYDNFRRYYIMLCKESHALAFMTE